MNIKNLQPGFNVVEVYSGIIWEAEIVKRILDNSEIGSFLCHKNMMREDYDPDRLKNVRVMIVDVDLKQAQQILDELFMEVEEYR
jgi:hypothetical protein